MLKKLNRIVATGLYSGLIPGAPGTYGSLLAGLFILIFPDILTSIYPAIIISIIGLISSAGEEKVTGIKDDPRIVIDEIAGMLIAVMGMEINIVIIIAAFLVFRFFDIFKPFPVNKMQNLPGGLGIMADDILAGLITRLILFISGGILYGLFW